MNKKDSMSESKASIIIKESFIESEFSKRKSPSTNSTQSKGSFNCSINNNSAKDEINNRYPNLNINCKDIESNENNRIYNSIPSRDDTTHFTDNIYNNSRIAARNLRKI